MDKLAAFQDSSDDEALVAVNGSSSAETFDAPIPVVNEQARSHIPCRPRKVIRLLRSVVLAQLYTSFMLGDVAVCWPCG